MGSVNDSWRLDLDTADAVIERALAQRDADRRNGVLPDVLWAAIADEVYSWKRAKTYLAAVLCGLVARATDDRANPLSLQVGEPGTYGYAATSLWKTILTQAQGRIDLRNLKDQPFNNSPFSGKRILSASWQNVSTANAPVLERTVELMDQVSRMARGEAAAALRGFLYSVPDAPERGAVDVSASGTINLVKFFQRLGEFLEDDGENGRRAQAMVAAALALVHPSSVDTPESVNDPSRTLAGDVRVRSTDLAHGRLALYAEAKQKRTVPELVDQFAEEVVRKDPAGVAAYGALVNARSALRSRRAVPLPSWRELLERHGVVMTIWEDPAEMVRDALVWSALDVRTGVGHFVERYVHYLQHVGAEPRTVDELIDVMRDAGVIVERR